MNQYDKKKLLNYIDAVSFALIDTNLYLDTHPNDKKAMDHFNQYQKARKQALKEYARNFEPLTIDSADIDDHYMGNGFLAMDEEGRLLICGIMKTIGVSGKYQTNRSQDGTIDHYAVWWSRWGIRSFNAVFVAAICDAI